MCRTADVRCNRPIASWGPRHWLAKAGGERDRVRLASTRPGRGHMIKLSVEIRSGSANFRVAVWAEGIQQALGLTRACYPGAEASVVFPIEPEAFFVKGITPLSGLVQPEIPEQIAG